MLTQRILVSYTTLALRPAFWQRPAAARRDWMLQCLDTQRGAGQAFHCYQVFPARAEFDVLLWTTVDCEQLDSPDRFLADSARRLAPFRADADIPLVLAGITKPSAYVKAHENPQEINPYDGDRKPYFVIYPFSKTADWYLKPREERQTLMTEHIRLGKTFPAIKQLLLYSFGIQDQEFIVAYEMDDLALFSDLVQALRSTAARAYTLLDTPIITGVRRTPEELAAIVAG